MVFVVVYMLHCLVDTLLVHGGVFAEVDGLVVLGQHYEPVLAEREVVRQVIDSCRVCVAAGWGPGAR